MSNSIRSSGVLGAYWEKWHVFHGSCAVPSTTFLMDVILLWHPPDKATHIIVISQLLQHAWIRQYHPNIQNVQYYYTYSNKFILLFNKINNYCVIGNNLQSCKSNPVKDNHNNKCLIEDIIQGRNTYKILILFYYLQYIMQLGWSEDHD